MSRLIDADEGYKILTEYYHHRTDMQHTALKEALDRVPTIDAEPVRHGKWEIHEAFGYMDMTCSVCGWLYEYNFGLEREWNFCSHCGAKMDGETT